METTKFPSDIEISRAAKLKPIAEIAANIGIKADDLIPYGKYKAKIPLSYLNEAKIKNGNLILVTAVTPTKAGVGKTVTSVALSLALITSAKKLQWRYANQVLAHASV